MDFTISTDSGSGLEYRKKEDVLEEIGLMIDDCIANGGTWLDFYVTSDVSCWYEDYEEEE